MTITRTDPTLAWFLTRSPLVRPRRLSRATAASCPLPPPTTHTKGSPYAHTRSGYRPDLDLVVRSGWEATTLRLLKALRIPYTYEPKVFTFPVRHGHNKTYRPDIRLEDDWIEIKGYFDPASRIKIKRFRIHYPEEFAKLTMIISRSSQLAHDLCVELKIPNVLYYEDVARLTTQFVGAWALRG